VSVAALVQNSATCGVHPLNDQVVKHHLLLGSLYDLLLHGSGGDQAIDIDLVLLPDTMGSRLCL